jgi:hypothetical protein
VSCRGRAITLLRWDGRDLRCHDGHRLANVDTVEVLGLHFYGCRPESGQLFAQDAFGRRPSPLGVPLLAQLCRGVEQDGMT